METTITRAKEIRPIAEKMITLGKKNTLASRRAAAAFLTRKGDKTSGKVNPETGRRDGQKDVLQKLFDEIAPKYANRPGGYCRITRIGPRRGDAAEMAVIELVEENFTAKATTTAPITEAPVKKAVAEEVVEAVELAEESEEIVAEELEAIDAMVEEAETEQEEAAE